LRQIHVLIIDAAKVRLFGEKNYFIAKLLYFEKTMEKEKKNSYFCT